MAESGARGVDTAVRSVPSWQLAEGSLDLSRPLGVGIVNVTDDSFFEGARSETPECAVEDGKRLVAEGFDLLDVGAVAARSGPPVPEQDEAERLVPAIEGLVREASVPITVDTFMPTVAELALDAGAAAINDISGSLDPAMLELVGDRGCGLVVMHIEGPPRVDRPAPDYEDPVDRMKAWFTERIEDAHRYGVAEAQLALDPGFDFDLTVDDDLAVMRRLPELAELGLPLFVAASRKDFIGALLAGSWEDRLPPSDREWGTAAIVALAVAGGANLLRLHDRSALDAMRVADRIANG
jgi:dihydropteroate synthase